MPFFKALTVVLLLLVSACSLPRRLDDGGPTATPVNEPRSNGPRSFSGRSVAEADDTDARGDLHTEFIQTMLAQKQYYAALAHLEQRVNESGSTPQLRYLEAEVRRRIGQLQQAEALYTGLLRGRGTAEYVGLAYQGLGLVAAERRDYRAAVGHLRAAAGRRPTDAGIRNDLGYALILAGRYNEALPEVATAVELDADDPRSRNNLVLLMILMKDEPSLRRVIAESGISNEELARLRAQAQSLSQRRTVEKAR